MYSLTVASLSKFILTFTFSTLLVPELSGTISTSKVPTGGITTSSPFSLYLIHTSLVLSNGIVIAPLYSFHISIGSTLVSPSVPSLHSLSVELLG
ncbi:hypothetical protein D3C76_1135630 [compost metagenome]